MTFAIRRAEIQDAAEIARIHVETWKTTYSGIVPETFLATLDTETRAESWRQPLADGTASILVAMEGNAVIGFACGGAIRERVDDYNAELYALYVQSDAQGRGAGRALCRAMAAELQSGGSRRLLLWVLEANSAVSFYQHLGGHAVAQKTIEIGGADLPEIALGWPDIRALAGAG